VRTAGCIFGKINRAAQGRDFIRNRVTAELVRSRLPELASRATTTCSRDIRTGVRASKTG
jgi:hypothetical protein